MQNQISLFLYTQLVCLLLALARETVVRCRLYSSACCVSVERPPPSCTDPGGVGVGASRSRIGRRGLERVQTGRLIHCSEGERRGHCTTDSCRSGEGGSGSGEGGRQKRLWLWRLHARTSESEGGCHVRMLLTCHPHRRLLSERRRTGWGRQYMYTADGRRSLEPGSRAGGRKRGRGHGSAAAVFCAM